MSDRDPIKDIAKLYELSKIDPVIGAEKLLGIKLAYHQKDMIRRIAKYKHPLIACSRRVGKTFCSALYLTLRALLFKDTKVGIVSPTFRQSKNVFEEIINLYRGNDILKIETRDRPKRGSSAWSLEFLNGSKIEATPFSNNLRGKSYTHIFIDEYSYGKNNINEMVSRILAPMIFVKRDLEEKNNEKITNNDYGFINSNQLIIASSKGFVWHDFYKKYIEYKDKIENGDENYSIIEYNFLDGLDSNLFEVDTVLQEYRNADPITRLTEYRNIFADGSDGFISYKLLEDVAIDYPKEINGEGYKEPKTKVEFEQVYDSNDLPKYEHIMALDDASRVDNFACAIIKIDGQTKRLVRVETLNNVRIKDKIKLIRDLLRKFNVLKICLDQRNRAIKDGLSEEYIYDDGYVGDIIVDEDDREQIKQVKSEYGNNVNIKKLITIHNFSNATNEMRARLFLNEIEKGRFKIPADPLGGYESKKEEKAYNEIKKTIFEITSIRINVSGNTIKYEPESSSQKKDRWTVCELGNYIANEYIKSKYKMTNENFVIGKRGGR